MTKYVCPDCGCSSFQVYRGTNWAVFCGDEDCEKLILSVPYNEVLS